MKRVLFYSSVTNKELFNIQQFYKIDISLLEQMGYEVILSNSIYDALKFWKYDFVFAYFYRFAFFVALIAFLFRKPIYFTGGIDKLDPHWATPKEIKIQQLFFYLCYTLATKCIIVSKTDLDNVMKFMKSNVSKLCFSEHTISVEMYSNIDKDKEDIFVTILWQGDGNIYRKGVDIALKIYSRIITDGLFPNSRFVIIGKKDKGTPILEKIVSDLGLETRVVFTDAIGELDKVNYLKQSRFYFQISKYEGFGLAPLEALCAKNIVIHSGRGGLSNPVYNYGILFDRDANFEQEYKKLLEKMNKYDNAKLNIVHSIIKEQYCHERRLNDFKNIIKL